MNNGVSQGNFSDDYVPVPEDSCMVCGVFDEWSYDLGTCGDHSPFDLFVEAFTLKFTRIFIEQWEAGVDGFDQDGNWRH